MREALNHPSAAVYASRHCVKDVPVLRLRIEPGHDLGEFQYHIYGNAFRATILLVRRS